MRKRANNYGVCLVVSVALLLIVLTGSALSQENKDENLKKKYAAILGGYKFDLNDLGQEPQIINFYVDDGHLWIDSGDGRPSIMEPEEDLELKFGASDPEIGGFVITFLKDDEGKYSQCRIYIEAVDLEITGIKIGG